MEPTAPNSSTAKARMDMAVTPVSWKSCCRNYLRSCALAQTAVSGDLRYDPAAMSTPMIVAEGLDKHFGTTHALRGLDLDVAEGTILALLGPNGAGKTTAVRILTTLLKPDRGRAEVAGIDVLAHRGDVRRKIGVAGQNATLDEVLTGRENLEMIGRLFRLS